MSVVLLSHRPHTGDHNPLTCQIHKGIGNQVLYKVECCEPPDLEMHTPDMDNSCKLKLKRDQSVKEASKHQ